MHATHKKFGYWIPTILISLAFTGAGMSNLMRAPDVVASMQNLGYPTYLPYILGVWKLLAALAFVAPATPRIKEWAYAGAFFLLTGAFVSHVAVGDALSQTLPPLVMLALVMTSHALRPADRRIVAAAGAEPTSARTRPSQALAL